MHNYGFLLVNAHQILLKMIAFAYSLDMPAGQLRTDRQRLRSDDIVAISPAFCSSILIKGLGWGLG